MPGNGVAKPRGRPPKKATSVAARALQAAIEEETAMLRGELTAAHQTISRLIGVLGGIAKTAEEAGAAVDTPTTTMSQALGPLPSEMQKMLEDARMPSQEPDLEPSGAELSGEDNMGEGRWI